MSDDVEEWNMAKAYLMRVDQLLTMCTMCQIKRRPLEWYDAILALYKEIRPKMKGTKKKYSIEGFDKIMKKLTEQKEKARNNQIKEIPMHFFLDAEYYLRDVLEDKGMLTPKGDDYGRNAMR